MTAASRAEGMGAEATKPATMSWDDFMEIPENKQKLQAMMSERGKQATKAKADAEKAGQGDKAELAKAAQEAATARQEAEELRKKLALADPTATEFKAYFEQLQQLWGGLTGVIGRAEPELGEKLKKATRKLLEKFGEALG